MVQLWSPLATKAFSTFLNNPSLTLVWGLRSRVELTVVSPFPREYPSPPRAAGTGRGRGQSLKELRGISGTGNSFNLEGVRGIFLNSYSISHWGRGFFSIPRISSQYTKYVFVVKCRRYKILRMLHLHNYFKFDVRLYFRRVASSRRRVPRPPGGASVLAKRWP